MNIFNPTRDLLKDKGEFLQQFYLAQKPCPHLVIDELFDSEILYCLLDEFLFDLKQAKLNWRITKDLKLESIAVRDLSDFTRTFYFWLNSHDFISPLTRAVGYEPKSLVGDPTLYGASLCGILPGGKLESCDHISSHPHLPLVCQFNLIICLNSHQNDKCEGNIELFDSQDEYYQSYQSQFNRTLILPMTNQVKYRITTSDRSYESSKFFSIYYWSLIPEEFSY